jgi:hypothetical protein
MILFRIMLSKLPYDVKRHEILPRLDCVSRMVLQHVLLHEPLRYMTRGPTDIIISYGLEFMKYFYERGLINDQVLPEQIAETGNLELLMWIHENGRCFDVKLCYSAALEGQTRMLRRIMYEGRSWNDSAVCGYIDCLKWLTTLDV